MQRSEHGCFARDKRPLAAAIRPGQEAMNSRGVAQIMKIMKTMPR